MRYFLYRNVAPETSEDLPPISATAAPWGRGVSARGRARCCCAPVLACCTKSENHLSADDTAVIIPATTGSFAFYVPFLKILREMTLLSFFTSSVALSFHSELPPVLPDMNCSHNLKNTIYFLFLRNSVSLWTLGFPNPGQEKFHDHMPFFHIWFC